MFLPRVTHVAPLLSAIWANQPSFAADRITWAARRQFPTVKVLRAPDIIGSSNSVSNAEHADFHTWDFASSLNAPHNRITPPTLWGLALCSGST